jgi:exodeoxyribonuclease VII small subunit
VIALSPAEFGAGRYASVVSTPPSRAKAPAKPHPPPELDPALTFEKAQEELEAIIRRIESGQIPLHEQMAQYQRGVQLHAHCRALLARFEQEFTDLTAQMNVTAPPPASAPSTDTPDRAGQGQA